MFVVDVHTLETVNFLYLVDQIFLKFAHTADLKDLMWDNHTVSQLLSFNHMVAALNDQVLAVWNEVFLFHARYFIAHDNDTLVLLDTAEVDHTVDLSDFSRIFRL